MIRMPWKDNSNQVRKLLYYCLLQANYFWPYVIESRLNDLNYIVNTPTRRKKRQICRVTTQRFSKKYCLIVDASDAVLLQERKDDIDLPNCYFFLNVWQRSTTIIHNWKTITCLIVKCKIKITDTRYGD